MNNEEKFEKVAENVLKMALKRTGPESFHATTEADTLCA